MMIALLTATLLATIRFSGAQAPEVPPAVPLPPPAGTAPTPAPIPAPTPAPAGGNEVRRFLESRHEEAKQAYEAGNFRLAWQIAEAILILSPDVPFHEDLRRLRRDAQGRYLAQSVVLVTFVPAAEPTFPIAELRGDVVIENHSAEAITIGSQEKEPVLGLARFRVSSLPEDSIGETAQEGTRVVRMPGEFRIEPGAAHRIPIAIEVPPAPEGAILLQRWTVDGVLRPITVRVGKELLTRGVPWMAAGGALVEPELADIPPAPLEHLRRALLTGDRRRLLAASALWWAEWAEEGEAIPPAEREQLVDELLACLGRFDGELDLPAIRLLEELTGEVRERTTYSWQIWGLTRGRPAPRAEER